MRRWGAGEGLKGRISNGKNAPAFPLGPPSQARPAVTPSRFPPPQICRLGPCPASPVPLPLSLPPCQRPCGGDAGSLGGSDPGCVPCVCICHLWDSVSRGGEKPPGSQSEDAAFTSSLTSRPFFHTLTRLLCAADTYQGDRRADGPWPVLAPPGAGGTQQHVTSLSASGLLTALPTSCI